MGERETAGTGGDAITVDAARKRLPAAVIMVVAVLIAAPLVAVACRGLLVWNGVWPHPSAGNFFALLGLRRFWLALFDTLFAAIATTVFSLALGCVLAFLMVRTNMPFRRLLGSVTLLPFFLSPYVGALSWVFLVAPHDGLLPTWLRDHTGIALEWPSIYSLAGVIFVLTLFHAPVVYLFAMGPMRDMDAALEDTARVLGATWRESMRLITLPLLLPALLPAALIVFVSCCGALDVPLVLGLPRGIPFLPTEVYTMARAGTGHDAGGAAAVAILLLLLAAVPMLWQRRFLARRNFGEIATGYPHQTIRLRWYVHIAALVLQVLYIGAGLILPLFALVLASLTRLWTGRFNWRAATEVNYESLLAHDGPVRAALGNSLLLAFLGATAGVILALPAGYYLTRGRFGQRRLPESLAALSPGVPAIVYGFGFLLLTAWTPLQGTLLVMLLACLTRLLPFAIANSGALVRTIDPGLEEAARGSGATRDRAVSHVVLPMSRASLLAIWLLLFALCVRELGAVILLYAPGNQTISVSMVLQNDRGAEYAAAVAAMQLVPLLLAFVLFRLVRAPAIPRPA